MRMSLAVCYVLLALCSDAGASPSVEDWVHDLDLAVADIQSIHPNPFTKIDRSRFLADTAALKAELPHLTEEQRMVRAMRLVASIGDGHTSLQPDNSTFGYWYPIRIYQFTDGYFITSAFKTDADLAGAQILRVAGRPVEDVVNAARSLMSADNQFGAKENLFAFLNASLMRGLGFAEADGSLQLRLKLRSGKIINRKLAAYLTDDKRFKPGDSKFDWIFVSEVFGGPLGSQADWTTAYGGLKASDFRSVDLRRPIHFTYRRPYISRAIPQVSAYFIQVNNVQDIPGGEDFNAFFRRALSEVDKIKPERLIVDIRFNPGGDGSKVPAMIREFIKREENRPWKHLYLLTGRKTFSAALMMLQAFVDHTEVSLIGEPAGAGPDSFGDATAIDLPRTGIELHVSTLFHKLDDVGERADLSPVDVPAPFSFADYVAGRDPAVDPVLEGREMRSLAIIALEDGPAFARKTYEKRKHQFANLPEWTAPRRIDLLGAVWKLLNQKRVADAADFAALVTEMYPSVARAWSVRGDAEVAANRKSDGLKSYHRALELDPNNLDNVSERKALADAGLPFSGP